MQVADGVEENQMRNTTKTDLSIAMNRGLLDMRGSKEKKRMGKSKGAKACNDHVLPDKEPTSGMDGRARSSKCDRERKVKSQCDAGWG